MRLSKKSIVLFQRKIFTWWQKNKRDLPWRHTHDPYLILISEVMLQQTQVFRVIPKYREFIAMYPTVKDLSKASTADVLRIWKGMGYNRRALYLKQTAQTIVSQYNGIVPKDDTKLRGLSGVGTYTASAIQVFAFKKDVAMVDTNIRRIITHYFLKDKPQKETIILDIATQLVPQHNSWAWHQALMDYGALVLSKRKSIKRIVKKTSIPFALSDRYFRGRMLDDLRVKSMRINSLKKKYSNEYKIFDEKFMHVLTGLIKDGLIEVSKGMVCLPK